MLFAEFHFHRHLTYHAWNATLWSSASETSPESRMYCYPQKHRLCLLSDMLTKLFPEVYGQQQGSRYPGTGKRGGPCYAITTRLTHIQIGQSVTPFCNFLNNNNKSIHKAHNLVLRDYSKHTCTHTGTTILSAYMHTHTHARTGSRTHEYADVIYIIQNSVNTQLAWTISRDLRQRKMAAWNGKYGRSIVWRKKVFWLHLNFK